MWKKSRGVNTFGSHCTWREQTGIGQVSINYFSFLVACCTKSEKEAWSVQTMCCDLSTYDTPQHTIVDTLNPEPNSKLILSPPQPSPYLVSIGTWQDNRSQKQESRIHSWQSNILPLFTSKEMYKSLLKSHSTCQWCDMWQMSMSVKVFYRHWTCQDGQHHNSLGKVIARECYWTGSRKVLMYSTSKKFGHTYSFKDFSLFFKTIFYIVE